MKFSVVGLPHYTIWHLYEPSVDDIRHMEVRGLFQFVALLLTRSRKWKKNAKHVRPKRKKNLSG